MAEKKTKAVDKWKLKEWYDILAPASFEHKKVGELISSDPANISNRIVPIALAEITGKMKPESLYTKLLFRVTDVKDKSANTEVIGMSLAFSYLRALARRRKSVIHDVIDINTKDAKKVRIKVMLVSSDKVSNVMKKNLRRELVSLVAAEASKKQYYELIKDIIEDKFIPEIGRALNKITPIDHLVIKKVELYETFN
jgi:small subunit ribosomal protein S3Ae